MASPRQSPVRRARCLLLLLVSLGCAHTPPSPLTEATKAQLGTIGVVAAQVTPEVDYRVPGQGGAGGAAIGVAKGVGLGALGAVGCMGVLVYCAPCLAACAVAAGTPYFAVRYAVDQATEGVPADTIEAAEAAIKAVLAGNHQAAARDALYQVAAAHTGQTLVLLPDPGAPTPSAAARYRHLADQGIDTVLEITVQRIALAGGSLGSSRATDPMSIRATELNPRLDLVVTTQRRVVKTADGTELYRRAGDHRLNSPSSDAVTAPGSDRLARTPRRLLPVVRWLNARLAPVGERATSGKTATFTDWGANDAQLLRGRLDQLFQAIAGEIVGQVFGVAVPPAHEPAAPAMKPEPEMAAAPSASEGPTE